MTPPPYPDLMATRSVASAEETVMARWVEALSAIGGADATPLLTEFVKRSDSTGMKGAAVQGRPSSLAQLLTSQAPTWCPLVRDHLDIFSIPYAELPTLLDWTRKYNDTLKGGHGFSGRGKATDALVNRHLTLASGLCVRSMDAG